ncbi:MAG TPA: HEAT repeat domain-containing protein [Acidimicrobiia bacterium]|nr:HEAT repeat domain-containing protein [Acidimicrobiia bacterium]
MVVDDVDAPDPVARAAAAVAIGLADTPPRSELSRVERLLDDADSRVRAAALGALVRASASRRARSAWRRAARDGDPAVRRRAAELAPALGRPAPVVNVIRLLHDADAGVAEAAAWALGELGDSTRHGGGVPALVTAATGHPDPLVREAAVAALGALGDTRGLDAILAACRDKPAVRRRAVLALAPFDGPAVDDALARARDDPDWQVRQAAEDLH